MFGLTFLQPLSVFADWSLMMLPGLFSPAWGCSLRAEGLSTSRTDHLFGFGADTGWVPFPSNLLAKLVLLVGESFQTLKVFVGTVSSLPMRVLL